MNWLASLFSNDEAMVCSITVGGLVCIFALVGVTIWQPGWNPTPYSLAAATLLGAIAGSKRWRDGPANEAK